LKDKKMEPKISEKAWNPELEKKYSKTMGRRQKFMILYLKKIILQ
jgi:hypothetical protein